MGTALIRNRANKHFAKNPVLLRNRNVFPVEKNITTDLKEGVITPLWVKEVAPGQTLDINLTSLVRLAPTVTPTMDNLIFKTFSFFVPYRQCWKHFVNFMGEKEHPEDPENEVEYTMPVINSGETGFASLSLADHFGLPTLVPNLNVMRLPFDAHNRIYNFYFRNQKLENAKFQDDGDEDGTLSNYDLYRISKARDYFTSCLPTINDGEPQVRLPIGTEAPVIGNGKPMNYTDGTDDMYQYNSFTGIANVRKSTGTEAIGDTATASAVPSGNKVMGLVTDIRYSGLIANLTETLGASILAVREAIALQEYQELNNRGGNRYFEQLANRYGTINPDLILHNPEYLGGTQKYINIMPVVQTSATSGQDTGAGNLTGYGIAVDGGNIIRKSFGEWGVVITYGVVTTYKKYQQGLHRQWSRFDKLDFMAPEFTLIGDQAVLNKEIYAQGEDVVDENGNIIDEQPFGYQERYAEYKYDLNEIHGEQRSNYPTSLDYNHLAEYYTELPVLNKNFDKENAPIERILQVTDDVQFLVDCNFTGENVIQLPINTIPAISSRFNNIA